MQAVLTMKSEKKNSKSPVIIAPSTLVAANVIPRSSSDVMIVPKTPTKNVLRFPQQPFRSEAAEVKSVIAKYPIAIPNKTHKNAGVIVTSAI